MADLFIPSIHLIDENKEFNKDLVSYIQNCYDSSIDNGLNYHVVSVFGSQSTGKSTLLNRLFGTKFDVMDETKRQQTTKGIWFSHANHIASSVSQSGFNPNDHNIFVLDVEGVDGREKADDKDFERKSALFALATSEILIVNIWEHQVGLYQGANMELLKTVMEVNLSLFHSSRQKCLLLFVVRDFTGVTPLDNLGNALTTDMHKIWSELNKPEGCKNDKLEDFFNLEFFSIAHKYFQSENFESNIKELGDEFHSETKLFKPEYHRGIPIDAWAIYSEQIWDQIEQNKDLDLPTQQILVARFRCDEILKDAYEFFEDEYHKVDFSEISNNPELIVEEIKRLRNTSLDVYDSQASRYTSTVYQERRKVLLNKIDLKLKEIHSQQLDKISKSLLSSFSDKVFKARKIDKSKAFQDTISSVSLELVESFTSQASVYYVDESFSFSKELECFNSSLHEAEEELKVKEKRNLVSRISRKFQFKFKDFVVETLSSPEENCWDEIYGQFYKISESLLSNFEVSNGEYDFQLGLNAVVNQETYTEIRKSFWIKFRDIIHDFATEDTVARILRNKFEDEFKYDQDGLPKLWKTFDEVDLQFTHAKAKTMFLLPVLCFAKLSDTNSEIIPDVDISQSDSNDEDYGDDVDISNFSQLLNAKQQNKVSQRLKKETDAIYIEAKRSVVANTTSIPFYIYMIIIILGWNEFMTIMRNPVLFVLSIILITGLYFAYNMQMLGPMLSVTNAMFIQTKVVLKEKLRDVLLDEKDQTQPTKEKTSNSYEMDELSESGKKKE